MNPNAKMKKKFYISDIFNIYNGKGITQEEIEEHPGNFIAVQSGENNNGVMGKIDKDYCIAMRYTYSEKPCLTVARSGTAGFVSYQKQGCVVGDSAKILELKDEKHLTDNIMCFLQTLLLANKYKFNYGYKVTVEKYSQIIIELPITDDGTPDWQFMEDYIKTLHYKPLTTQNKADNVPKLDIEEWENFVVKDIFPYKRVKHYSAIPEEDGQYEFVSSTTNDNGVSKYVDAQSVNGNCITVSTNGECFSCFYHELPIVVSSDVEVLYSSKINKYSALFICSVLEKEKYRWNYGRKPKSGKVRETVIKLPVTTAGEPDWQWMEDYIKALPYGDRI